MDNKPEVVRRGLLGMQVCVPKDYTNKQAEQFANDENPTGIDSRWTVCRQGDDQLAGHDERVQCEQRPDYCHILLTC